MSSKRAGPALLIAVSLHLLLLWILLRPPARLPIPPPLPPVAVSLVGPPAAATPLPAPSPTPTPTSKPAAQPLSTPSPVRPASHPAVERPTLVSAPLPSPPPLLGPTDLAAEPEALHPPTFAAPTSSVVVADCGLAQIVQRALRADPAVQAALVGIPSRAMTPARVLMLWNASWIAVEDGQGGRSVAPIRRAIVQLVRAAPAGCPAAEVRGPEFLILPSPSGTVVMAIGSAAWRWSDLVATDAMAPETP